MKPEELRVGNLVYFGGDIIKVEGSHLGIEELYENFEPIKLDDNRLIEVGLELLYAPTKVWGKDGVVFSWLTGQVIKEKRILASGKIVDWGNSVEDGNLYLFYPMDNKKVYVTYVHELQNLYYALKRKELIEH